MTQEVAELPVRSALFVPANRRSWIEGAPTYGADVLVLDLEDATPPSEKERAREIVHDSLPMLRAVGQRVWIRINDLQGGYIDDDLDIACREGVDVVCLPKTEGPSDVKHLDRKLGYYEGNHGLPFGKIGIYPLLETARAMLDPAGIFRASERVRYAGALAAPGADVEFALGFRWTSGFTETLQFRSAALVAARACGISNPVTGLVTSLDVSEARAFADHSRNLGYAGMFVIHPTHVDVVNEIFSPTAEEYAWSRGVLEEFQPQLQSGRGTMVDSRERMIDLATVRVAERIAERYEFFAAGGSEP